MVDRPASLVSGPTPPKVFLTRPLRVVIVCPSGQIGGAERWLLRLLDGTDRLTIAAVVMGDGPLSEQWRARGVPVTTLPVGRGPLAVARAANEVRAVLRKEQPDVVLANGVRAGTAAVPTMWLHGMPVVWVKHDHAFDGPLSLALGRSCAQVVAPSGVVGRAGTGRVPVVIPAPRDSNPLWGRERARSQLASLVRACGGVLPAEAPLVLAVGARVPLKGLVDAVAAVSAAGDWHLGIIGSDDPSSPGHGVALHAEARRLGVGHRVHLMGPVAEAAQLMPGAEALLQLTRSAGPGPDREGYGMAVMEAACAGLPIICTPCPAAEDLMQAGAGTGVFMVQPATPDSVAQILNGLTDVSMRRAAGAAVKAASQRHPPTKELADRLASTLASCAGRAGAGATADNSVPVSVVAPVYAEGRAAGELVRIVGPLLGAQDELIVVDDASPDDTIDFVSQAMLEAPGAVQLVQRRTNGGVGAARNSGVRAAHHDLVVFVDAGTTPAAGWLDAMRAAAATDPTPGLLAGSYTVSRRDSWQSAVAAACYPSARPADDTVLWRRAWHMVFGLRLQAKAPAGRSLAISREAWTAIGGFDERRRAAEDVDAGYAVTAKGFACALVTDAVVEWDQAESWRGTVAMYRHYGRGDAQADHFRAVARDVARAVVYPLAAIAVVPGPRAGIRRCLVGAAAVIYASVPLARAAAQPQPYRVLPLVPIALVVKDLAKSWGAIEVLLCERQ